MSGSVIRVYREEIDNLKSLLDKDKSSISDLCTDAASIINSVSDTTKGDRKEAIEGNIKNIDTAKTKYLEQLDKFTSFLDDVVAQVSEQDSTAAKKYDEDLNKAVNNPSEQNANKGQGGGGSPSGGGGGQKEQKPKKENDNIGQRLDDLYNKLNNVPSDNKQSTTPSTDTRTPDTKDKDYTINNKNTDGTPATGAGSGGGSTPASTGSGSTTPESAYESMNNTPSDLDSTTDLGLETPKDGLIEDEILPTFDEGTTTEGDLTDVSTVPSLDLKEPDPTLNSQDNGMNKGVLAGLGALGIGAAGLGAAALAHNKKKEDEVYSYEQTETNDNDWEESSMAGSYNDVNSGFNW